VKLYGLKTCDTCRKALKSLGTVEFHDLRGSGESQIDDMAAVVRSRAGA